MRRALKVAAVIIGTALIAFAATTPAQASAAVQTKQCAVMEMHGNDLLHVSANQHTSCYTARKVARSWFRYDSVFPRAMFAAGKSWYRGYHYVGDYNGDSVSAYKGYTSLGHVQKVYLYWQD